jgi:ketosteroid isomerase-like protein
MIGIMPKSTSYRVRIYFQVIAFILASSGFGIAVWTLASPSILALDKDPVIGTVADLEKTVQLQADAWNRGDIADFMIPYWRDDRLTFSSGGQTERGWDRTYQRYKNKYPDRAAMGRLTFGNLESQELGPDAILMLGTWRLEREIPIGGNFSLVWKRIDGQWRIVHDHSSAKPEQ